MKKIQPKTPHPTQTLAATSHHLLSFPRSALSMPRRGSPPPRLLTRATAVAAPSYCRRHPPLAPVDASANEEAGTVGSGDPGLIVGGSGRPEARGDRLSPSLLFSFYVRHRYNDGRADRVRQRVAAPFSSPFYLHYSFADRRRPATTTAARASNRGGRESPDPEGRRPDSEREQPDLCH